MIAPRLGVVSVHRFCPIAALISRSAARFRPHSPPSVRSFRCARRLSASTLLHTNPAIRMSAQPKKVTIVGSGNWGSAIARIVGVTTKANPKEFDSDVVMYVYEEQVEGGKLSEIINTRHENVKYLPGKKLPENVRAVTDLVESCKEADVLIFVVPHQFVHRICDQLKGKLKQGAGVAVGEGGGIHLISEIIRKALGIEVAVLMGANLAPEVANENFCEATIGTKDVENLGAALKKLFHTDYFRINVVRDADTVELCGALKNVVACAAGFSDGLGFGDNTKAAIIRLGLMETIRVLRGDVLPGLQVHDVLRVVRIADLVTTCYGGRNRKVCAAFAKTGKTIAELEKELLNGQSAQGPPTAAELYQTLQAKGVEKQFPLFVAVHKICSGELPADKFIDQIRDHPEHHSAARSTDSASN
ncbi:Glycerol-3-phosphate dehydrogenase [NAD(+)] [Aphelenchoides fujianensis]|nr:Glycerol-3-phosphate dehydrogenase [NAD(+)] [Aphelenchoides fujianensis]